MFRTLQKSARLSILLIAFGAGLAGCGESSNTVWVKGRLLKGGARYVPPQGHVIELTFVASEIENPDGQFAPSSEPFDADYNDDEGTFFVPGRQGRGIPRGKYRVAVTQRMLREAFDAARPKAKPGEKEITRETDFLGGRFPPSSSPIVREIRGATELVIDLDDPTKG
jgi:hypothetical protein